jgi:hypothetical protein
MNASAGKLKKQAPFQAPGEYVAPGVNGQIQWSAIAAPTSISFLGTSFWPVKEALIEVFGEFPFNLGAPDLPILKAMAAVSKEGATPYINIIDALEKYGALSIDVAKS